MDYIDLLFEYYSNGEKENYLVQKLPEYIHKYPITLAPVNTLYGEVTKRPKTLLLGYK